MNAHGNPWRCCSSCSTVSGNGNWSATPRFHCLCVERLKKGRVPRMTKKEVMARKCIDFLASYVGAELRSHSWVDLHFMAIVVDRRPPKDPVVRKLFGVDTLVFGRDRLVFDFGVETLERMVNAA